MKLKNKISIVLLVAALAAPAVVFAAAPAQLYIAEIQTTGGPGKTDQDFVSLFNPNSLKVDLKGYRLVKRSATSDADVLMKSWDKDAYVPPKSFYLWANSSYFSISPTPDILTAATLSDDNGVALRFGSSNTGKLIDSVAWGKADNGFNNVLPTNPGAGQAIFKKDWSNSGGVYYIASAHPFNSAITDVAAAYLVSQNNSAQPTVTVSHSTEAVAEESQDGQDASATQAQQTLPTQTTSQDQVQNSPTPTFYSTAPNQGSKGAAKYLILAAAAVAALGFLAYNFWPKKS